MKIKLNIDTEKFKNKPQPFDPRLRNRLCSAASIREITPEQLIEVVRQGRSFTPAAMSGTTGDTWQTQQVVCADIDNDTGKKDADGKHIRISEPLTPERAREVMAQHGIDPYFMYYSFSNSDGWPKFRIVLILDTPITDRETAKDLIDRFVGIFNHAAENCADKKISDNARLFYGCRPDDVFYISNQTTSTDLLQALPVYEDTETPTEAVKAEWEYKRTPAPQNGVYRPYSELQARFIRDKESFDLAAYIETTTGSRPKKVGRALYYNPCPLCGHNDDFQVTGSIYHCFGANGGSGGTIIDYLVNRHKIDVGAACEKFKFEIMGYDREEWQQAYYAEYGQQPTDATVTPAEEQPAETILIESTTEYIKNKMAAEIEGLRAQSNRKTGFANLDAEAGSIYAGLYSIGGISSVGKTTFISQLADQMAAQGQHVLFFSMEQSRLEMVSKSIARQTAQDNKDRTQADGSITGAVNSLQIRTGAKGANISKAITEYTESVGDRISIIEGNFGTTVSFIGEYTRQYIAQNGGVKPVLIVDYLQVLAAEKDPETGRKPNDVKQKVDYNVTELKRLSRSLEIPVFVISSVNRSNYLAPIDFEAFKESGGIEFTSDVVWGLQLSAIHDPIFAKEKDIVKKRETIAKAKEAMPRDIELVCLKNRYGKSRYTAQFTYYPQYDCYFETTTPKYSIDDFIDEKVKRI